MSRTLTDEMFYQYTAYRVMMGKDPAKFDEHDMEDYEVWLRRRDQDNAFQEIRRILSVIDDITKDLKNGTK